MAAYLLTRELPGIRRHFELDLGVIIQPNQIVRTVGDVVDGVIDIESDEVTFTVVYSELVKSSRVLSDDS